MRKTATCDLRRYGRSVCAAVMLAVSCLPACLAEDSVAPVGGESVKSPSSEQQELAHRILQQSQAARNSLGEKRVDEQTRASQQQVVDDLAKLIEMLKKASPPKSDSNPPPNPNPNSQPKPDSGSGSSSANQRKNSGEQPSSGKASSGSAADSDGGQNREQPEDSEERHGELRAAKARADRKLRLESDVWGHLPPALREKLLNNYGERMLPQYEEFVRKFYDALSEPTRSSKR